MHGTLQIKIFTGSNVQNLESTINTFLTQQGLTNENFIDMKITTLSGQTPIGIIILIYRI